MGHDITRDAPSSNAWFIYIPAKWCALNSFVIFNLQR